MAIVYPLPSCIDEVGPSTFKWWCWRCRKYAARPAKTVKTALRQLDRHCYDRHRADLPYRADKAATS